MMRLPTEMNRVTKKQRVLETIQFLELSHVMDSIIGDEGVIIVLFYFFVLLLLTLFIPNRTKRYFWWST
jgi:hypothetical protein